MYFKLVILSGFCCLKLTFSSFLKPNESCKLCIVSKKYCKKTKKVLIEIQKIIIQII